MLAITYMKRNKNDKMRSTFEKAVQGSPKEPLLWSLYAYCLCKSATLPGQRRSRKGLKKTPGNEAMREPRPAEEGKK